MEITIEESINGIEKRILPIFDNDADHKALVKALDIMCKYQKIEQVTKEWGRSGLLQDKFYDLINEVVEDGNDNQDRK